jgi:hypothetical protein
MSKMQSTATNGAREMREATIVVNGRLLTQNEAMTLRVLLCSNLENDSFDCGDDEHGQLMSKTYRDAVQSILRTILQN